MKDWETPEVTAIELKSDEDVLAACWAESTPAPVLAACLDSLPTCPM